MVSNTATNLNDKAKMAGRRPEEKCPAYYKLAAIDRFTAGESAVEKAATTRQTGLYPLESPWFYIDTTVVYSTSNE